MKTIITDMKGNVVAEILGDVPEHFFDQNHIMFVLYENGKLEWVPPVGPAPVWIDRYEGNWFARWDAWAMAIYGD